MRAAIASRVKTVFISVVTACLLASPAAAEDGVTSDTIVFGQAAVLQGPASALGQGMRAGISAAFEEANKNGGVHGRKLSLTSVDDGYEPDKSITATKKLIEQDKVFALIARSARRRRRPRSRSPLPPRCPSSVP